MPVDFSKHSREALKLAVSLAADPEDRITLLHIVAPESVLHRGNAVMMTLQLWPPTEHRWPLTGHPSRTGHGLVA